MALGNIWFELQERFWLPILFQREEICVLEINADLCSMGGSGEVCDMEFLFLSWFLQEPGVKVADNRCTEIMNQSVSE